MKYKCGDFVYISDVNNTDSIYPLQIIDYDEKNDKYRCVSSSTYSPGDDGTFICIVSSKYIDAYEFTDSCENKDCFRLPNGDLLFPSNIDQNFFDICEYFDGKMVLIRRAFRRRKPFEIPTIINSSK